MAQEFMAYSEDYTDFLVAYQGDMEEIRRRYQPAAIQEAGRFLIIYKPVTSERTISIETFGYSALPRCLGLLGTNAAAATGALRIRQQPYLNLYGQGVLVGVVDTGVDYLHPAFQNTDGTSRILSIWDQTRKGTQEGTFGKIPEGFFFGTEYTREEINLALAAEHPLDIVPFQDENGHGTFLAGVIAGNEVSEQDFSGIAPYAELIAVKVKPARENLREYYKIPNEVPCYAESDVMLGIRYVLLMARRLRRPVVLCLGMGTNQGGHDGMQPLGVYMKDFGEYRGVGMVCSAGNETNRAHHYRGRLTRADAYTDVEISVDTGEEGFSLELWGTVPALFSVGIYSPAGEVYEKIPVQIGQETKLPFLLDGSTVYISYRIVEEGSGEELVLLRMERPSPGIWGIRVYLEKENMGIFDMWLPMEGFLRRNTFFLQPDPQITICEPGNSSGVLTAAGYDAQTGGIYLNSSRGYTRDDRVVPDLAAPAVQVNGPYPGNRYGTMTGTSVAAACTAGVCALLLEWGVIRENDLDMDTNELTKLLIRGAARGNSLQYPNREWGYGILSADGVFESIRITR